MHTSMEAYLNMFIVCHLHLIHSQEDEKFTTIEVATTGRLFKLGALYDARTDQILGGAAFSLWDYKKIHASTLKESAQQTTMDMAASKDDNLNKDLFEISAQLSASIKSGMITISGAAHFGQENSESSLESAVLINYKKHLYRERISPNLTSNLDYPQVFDTFKDTATHIVTELLYGGTACFRFSRIHRDKTEALEFGGTFTASMNKAGLKLNGSMTLNFTHKEQTEFENLTVSFRGNINLDEIPTNFESAMSTIKKIPKLINKENSTALSATLAPIKLFDSEESRMLRKISAGLLERVKERYKRYDELLLIIKDLEMKTRLKKLDTIKKHVGALKLAYNIHRSAFNSKMRDILPKLRGTGAAEQELIDALDDEGVYTLHTYKLWVDQKNEELGAYDAIYKWDNDKNPLSILENVGIPRMKLIWNYTINYLFFLEFKVYPRKDLLTVCAKNENQTGCKPAIHYNSWLNNGDEIRHQFLYFLKLKKTIEDKLEGAKKFSISFKGILGKNDTNPRAEFWVFQGGNIVELSAIPSIRNISVQRCNTKVKISWESPRKNGTFLEGNFRFTLKYRLKRQYWHGNNTSKPKKLNVRGRTSATIEPWQGEEIELILSKMCHFKTAHDEEITMDCVNVHKNFTAHQISQTEPSPEFCSEKQLPCVYKKQIVFQESGKPNPDTPHYAVNNMEECCFHCKNAMLKGGHCIGYSFYYKNMKNGTAVPTCALYQTAIYRSFNANNNLNVTSGVVLGRGSIPPVQ